MVNCGVIEVDGAALAQGPAPKERVALNAHLWRFKLQIAAYLEEARMRARATRPYRSG
jgi:hypothetical protein